MLIYITLYNYIFYCLYNILQDVSSNEISHLPPQLCELDMLNSLNLRKNLLVELPSGERDLLVWLHIEKITLN